MCHASAEFSDYRFNSKIRFYSKSSHAKILRQENSDEPLPVKCSVENVDSLALVLEVYLSYGLRFPVCLFSADLYNFAHLSIKSGKPEKDSR